MARALSTWTLGRIEILIVLALLVSINASAQKLFSEVPAPEKTDRLLNTGTLRQRTVEFHPEILVKGRKIQLNFFQDRNFIVSFDRIRIVEDELDPREVWQGNPENAGVSDALLFVRKNGISGFVTVEGMQYQIRSIDNGMHEVSEVDLKAAEGGKCGLR